MVLTNLETVAELEVLDSYFLAHSYVSGHQYSGMDVCLYRAAQGAWICTKGQGSLYNLTN